jgi:hypothetical protein
MSLSFFIWEMGTTTPDLKAIGRGAPWTILFLVPFSLRNRVLKASRPPPPLCAAHGEEDGQRWESTALAPPATLRGPPSGLFRIHRQEGRAGWGSSPVWWRPG